MSVSLFLLASVAAPFADLDAIDRQVASFTGAPAGETGGAATPVDRRLRLQPCRSGLALSWRTPAQDSVVVQCGDPSGWRLFVPVRSGGAGSGQGGPVAVARGDAVAIAVTGEGFTVSQPGEAMESGPVGAWIRVRPAAVPGKATRGDVMRARIERPGLVSLPLP
jgi:flagella basal body P-ring formation protein FlgA